MNIFIKTSLQILIWIVAVLGLTLYLNSGNTIHPIYILLIGYLVGGLSFQVIGNL